ncbi:PREDICTED: pentatricopeptide repeat-containing protein At1g43980, mitochondrial [Camelina sativa]|uniref:Pentatricopeptide repeat-containing protein At1g43980, mitochondrial n=1 Tax=Camelina sativa TaxID=90675 RepID=A0ABM0X5C9_CAMSA|nr:PREDICTED: pentatricopeptide repeat-containing protein At1g43980, mitochondrial [Camelina sativa]
MFQLLRRAHGLCMPSSFYLSRLVDRSLLSKCPTLARVVHAQLLKVGFIPNTFWGNRCLQLYFKSGSVFDAFQLFEDIPDKNTISWNVSLKGLLKNGYHNYALDLFDEMPERDVVSWNTMISGLASCGFPEYGMRVFLDMQSWVIRPTEFTFSILASLVSCVSHGEQIHGNAICSGVSKSNLVVWNSFMDMYRRIGVFDYALSVFLTMEDRDVISWNCLILCCSDSGDKEVALDQFGLMREMGNQPDEYTVSTVVSICSDLRDLCKGKQAIALCIKMGVLSNTIVLGAGIDMFSKCNRLDDSVKLFRELEKWDSVLCNSMIGSYSWHGFGEDALRLFIVAMRQSIRPDKFTLSSVLSSMNAVMLDHGAQVHSLAIKLGFDEDTAAATSLMEMYFKAGLIDSAMRVFATTDGKDLIFWNTVIMGLARNSRAAQSLAVFNQLLMNRGLKPDRVTFMGILIACCYAGFVNEGIQIFSSMVKTHGVNPGNEHYASIIELLCRAGMIIEAKDIADKIPFKTSSPIWEPILCASLDLGDTRLAETMAKTMLESEPKSSFPYLVLIKLYEMTWRWENSVKIRYAMNEQKIKSAQGSSKIGIKSSVYSFEADQLQIHGGQDTCAVLDLLSWDFVDQKIHWSA